MASKKSKKNKPAGGSLARGLDEFRRRLLDLILKMMNDVSEMYGDPERHKQTRRECAAAIGAYAVYAEAMTGDQYMFNLQSKYSSDETVVAADTFVYESRVAAIKAYFEYADAVNTGGEYVCNSPYKYSSDETVVVDDTFVDESTAAAKSGDLKTFSNLFEELLDKLNDMAGLLPVSKTCKAKAKEGDDVNVKVKERTTLIKSGSDAKGRATDGEKEDLVGIAEQLLKMRYQSLHQNNRYISSTFGYNGGLNVSTNLGTDKKMCKY